jgi:hypothetical protein
MYLKQFLTKNLYVMDMRKHSVKTTVSTGLDLN